MRVVCPACEAAYEVPAPMVEARRTLRCARCGTQFTAGAPLPGPAPLDSTQPPPTRLPDTKLQPTPPLPALAVPDDTAQPKSPVQVPRPAPGVTDPRAPDTARITRLAESSERHAAAANPPVAAVLAAWALSLVLLAAGAGAALAWRQPIMRAWPPSARAYAALGYVR